MVPCLVLAELALQQGIISSVSFCHQFVSQSLTAGRVLHKFSQPKFGKQELTTNNSYKSSKFFSKYRDSYLTCSLTS